jgi:serine/threonine-protein phosphatase 2A regulatory subunit B
MNGAATHVASGSYSNAFRVFGAGGGEATLEATRDPMRRRAQAAPAKVRPQRRRAALLCARHGLRPPPGRSRRTAGCGALQRPLIPPPPARAAQGGNRFGIRSKAPAGKRSPCDPPEPHSDYSSKLLHLAWHPEADVVACAAANSLYMYCA